MNGKHDSDVLASALLDLVGMLNSPRQDDVLLEEAGVAMDRALFPLLVRVGAVRSLSVIELAEQVGRDSSTVSRQVAKLADLGLVTRRQSARDQRVREAAITANGRKTVKAIAAARRRHLGKLLAGWNPEDRETLARLNRRFADAMMTARRRQFAAT